MTQTFVPTAEAVTARRHIDHNRLHFEETSGTRGDVTFRAVPLAQTYDALECLIVVHEVPTEFGKPTLVLTYRISIDGLSLTRYSNEGLKAIRDYVLESTIARWRHPDGIAKTPTIAEGVIEPRNEFYLVRYQ